MKHSIKLTMKPYRSKNYTLPTDLTFGFSETARRRIYSIIFNGIRDHESFRYSVESMVRQNEGALCKSAYDAARQSQDPVEEHFLCCPDEKALSFLNYIFAADGIRPFQGLVDAVNQVFKTEGIGYRMTDCPRKFSADPPEVFQIGNSEIDEAVIKPAFHFLVEKGYESSHRILLSAFAKCQGRRV